MPGVNPAKLIAKDGKPIARFVAASHLRHRRNLDKAHNRFQGGGSFGFV